MSVVHIGTADNAGGAARAAFRIHTGLQRANYPSKILAMFSVQPPSPDIDCIPRQKTLFERAYKLAINSVEEWTGLENQILPWKRQFLSHPSVRESRIVHLHNLHGGFFSQKIIPELARRKPVVWSLHDMWPLTGHCYYPEMFDCSKWKTGCGECPGLKQDNHYPLSIDTTRFLWSQKKKIYSSSRLTLVAQSKWTQDQIAMSPLFEGKPVRRIPYALDTDLFRPIDRRQAREILGVPTDSLVVFFSAIGLNSERKGWKYLNEALDRLQVPANRKLMVLASGNLGSGESIANRFSVMNLGYISDDRMMILAYSAADLFVGASLYETFGLVFLEALACGTPCVAFDTSGVRDVVRHMENGYLAPLRDSEALAHGIQRLLEDDELRNRLGRKGREIAVNEYSLPIQTKRYLDLYQEVLS
jgi:glycosyltransferase involved in cell wall biosynthesis